MVSESLLHQSEGTTALIDIRGLKEEKKESWLHTGTAFQNC